MTHHTPADLDEDTLRALWRFRLTHMALKPHVDLEVEYTTFCALIRRGVLSWVHRDRAGTVRGMAHFIATRHTHQGRAFVFFLVEYIYTDPGHRKGPGLAVATVHALARCVRRFPGLPIYLGGPGYPGGFLLLCHVADPVWLWHDPTLPPWEAGAMAAVASGFPGWDPVTGCVTMKTVPLHPRTAPPRSPRLRALHQRYVTVCPRWAEGNTAFSWGRLSVASVALLARSLAERMM